MVGRVRVGAAFLVDFCFSLLLSSFFVIQANHFFCVNSLQICIKVDFSGSSSWQKKNLGKKKN